MCKILASRRHSNKRLVASTSASRIALVMPQDVKENFAFLRDWRRLDTFDFDYHLMWAHFQDPGHLQIAARLHADIGRLRVHGLNGTISFQVQRLFLPTGLPMAMLGTPSYQSPDTNPAHTLSPRKADLRRV